MPRSARLRLSRPLLLRLSLLRLSALVAGSAVVAPALAFSTFLHLQGAPGSREAYFSEVSSSDRTPVTREALAGPVVIRELGVTAVYEHADKPEWAGLRLQFECPNAAAAALGGKPAAAPGPRDPVRFRIAAHSYQVRRSDLAAVPLPESDWNSSAAPMLVKASRIACNDLALNAAIRRAIKQPTAGAAYDEAGFGRDLEPLGLPADLVLLGYTQANEQADFCWSFLWGRHRRPDPSGRWSRPVTDADRAEAQRRMQDLHDRSAPLLAAARASLETNLRRMQGQREFDERARRFRADRKLNTFETQLIAVWSGVPEEQVVEKMGAPLNALTREEIRTLSYSKEWDRTRVVADLRTGAAWEEGPYSRCDMDFLIIRDAENRWRVADVRVKLDSNAYVKFTCNDLAKVPD